MASQGEMHPHIHTKVSLSGGCRLQEPRHLSPG